MSIEYSHPKSKTTIKSDKSQAATLKNRGWEPVKKQPDKPKKAKDTASTKEPE